MDKTIKISCEDYFDVRERKNITGASIKFIVSEAIRQYLKGKKKRK